MFKAVHIGYTVEKEEDMNRFQPNIIKLGNPMTNEQVNEMIKDLIAKRYKETDTKKIEEYNKLLDMAYERKYANL